MSELQVSISNCFKEAARATGILLEKLEKAKKDLESTPSHKWEHGDVFKANGGGIMMYLGFTIGPPRLVCIVGICGGLVEKKNFSGILQEGKFLFNIKEKL